MTSAELLVGHSISPDVKTQLFLPVRMGGLGIRSPICTKDPSRLSAMASYIRNTLPALAPQTLANIYLSDWHPVISRLRNHLGPSVEPLQDWSRNPLNCVNPAVPILATCRSLQDNIHIANGSQPVPSVISVERRSLPLRQVRG